MTTRVAVVVSVVLSALCGIGPTAQAGPVDPTRYLALGDSLAVGFQPNRGQTGHGYVDVLARRVRKQLIPDLEVRNVGCPGETSRSMISGDRSPCSYAAGSQLDTAVAFLEAHPGEVAFITIDIGVNDLLGRCLEPSLLIPKSCAVDQRPKLGERIELVVDALQQAAGPEVPVVGMTYYNPFLGLRGLVPGGRALARANQRAWASFNDGLASAYADAGATVADVATRFRIDDFDETVVVPGHGRIPVNVALACRWTWFCSSRSLGDPHPNRTGYRRIAGTYPRELEPLLGAAGIEFPGWDPTTSSLIAEVEMTEEPELGIRNDAVGTHALGRLEYEVRDGKVVYADSGPVGVMVTEPHVGSAGEPTLRDLSEALIAVYGTDYGIHSPTWISRFTDMTRQAATYRVRRVLLAGDAAHVHSPVGGQGLNTGVQDAVNLGWKLAQVVHRTSPDSLLDTYHAERHPVAARVLRTTMAQVVLLRTDDRTEALRDTVAELLGMDEPRKRLAAELSGLGIHYDLGEGHPLLGRRMPDLDLVTADGPLGVFTLLHDARPMLLNLGEPGGFDITPWADQVQSIDATYGGAWELPALGTVPAPTAVLIRPDGYVAWVGDRNHEGLPDALTAWFGPPTAA